MQNGMQCTEMWKLSTCQNRPNDENDEDIPLDIEDDDDIEEMDY